MWLKKKGKRRHTVQVRPQHRSVEEWCLKNSVLWEAALVQNITSGYLAVQSAQGGEKELILCGCGIGDSTMWHLAKNSEDE